MTKISGQLSTINRNQKYFRTRENRNFSTVRSTERRIFNFSVVESAMMVCMAGLQVFIVRFFFQGARKGECGEICEDGFGGTGSLMGNRVCVREETGGGVFCPCGIGVRVCRRLEGPLLPVLCTCTTQALRCMICAPPMTGVRGWHIYIISWPGVFNPEPTGTLLHYHTTSPMNISQPTHRYEHRSHTLPPQPNNPSPSPCPCP